jgi:N-acetylmuramoyl-L-alanine amidase
MQQRDDRNASLRLPDYPRSQRKQSRTRGLAAALALIAAAAGGALGVTLVRGDGHASAAADEHAAAPRTGIARAAQPAVRATPRTVATPRVVTRTQAATAASAAEHMSAAPRRGAVTSAATSRTQPAHASTAAARSRALRGKVIVLDPGHNPGNAAHAAEINQQVWAGVPENGGRKACDTTGTSTDAGFPEALYTWDVTRRVGAILRADGLRVIYTRTANIPAWGPCINERAAIGNRAHAAAAVSIHGDGGPASGRGFFTITPAAPILATGLTAAMVAADGRLALAVRNAYHQTTGVPYSNYLGSAGIYRSNEYGGTNLSHVPKVFIETANMRNASDAALIVLPAFRQSAALGIAHGIESFITHG